MDTVVFTGRMTLEELKHDKPKLYAELAATGELEKRLVDPPSAAFLRTVRIFGYTALFVGFTLVVLIIYSMLFSYR